MWSDSIKQGNKIMITAKSGSYSKVFYVSQVEEIYDFGRMLIYTPIAERNYIRLPKDNDYTFLFYTDDGLLQTSGKILEHLVQNEIPFMKIKTGEFERVQRRLFFRLNYNLDLAYTRAEEAKNVKPGEEPPTYKGLIKDISGGGLRFLSDAELKSNEHITCRFMLKDAPIETNGKVLETRNTEDTKETYKFEYRIVFENISKEVQEQITHFVFFMQLEMLSKIKSET